MFFKNFKRAFIYQKQQSVNVQYIIKYTRTLPEFWKIFMYIPSYATHLNVGGRDNSHPPPIFSNLLYA